MLRSLICLAGIVIFSLGCTGPSADEHCTTCDGGTKLQAAHCLSCDTCYDEDGIPSDCESAPESILN